MKNLITLISLFVTCIFTNAQTVEETLEWLDAKKVHISDYYSSSNNVGQYLGNVLEFSMDGISIRNDDKGVWTKFNWFDITDVTTDDEYDRGISVINKKKNDKGHNYVISIHVENSENRKKFIKAIKTMATLKGAKLVKEDLF